MILVEANKTFPILDQIGTSEIIGNSFAKDTLKKILHDWSIITDQEKKTLDDLADDVSGTGIGS